MQVCNTGNFVVMKTVLVLLLVMVKVRIQGVQESHSQTQPETPPLYRMKHPNSLYTLFLPFFSANLAPCPGSAPHHSHQSHIPLGGERAGGDGAAELAVPGGDGQFPAAHGPAAEDSDRAGQAGQLLLPGSCRHTGQNPS